MRDFITWLRHNFIEFIADLSASTVRMVDNVFRHNGDANTIADFDINLVLFSETPILSTNLYDFLLLAFGTFYTIMFVVIVYKIIKKVLVTITRWNKW